MKHTIQPRTSHRKGFTFIELMVVMSIVGLLLSIALPRYFEGLHRSKEAVLAEDLRTMRDAIDHFRSDKGAYPRDLQDLVNQRYLRELPIDPITDRADTWIIISPPDNPLVMADIQSGAQEKSTRGTPYSTW